MEPIDLRRLPDDGLALDEPLSVEWLDTQLNEDALEGLTLAATRDGRLEGRLDKIDRDAPGDPVVRLTGVVGAHLRASCVRCLSDVDTDFELKLDLTFFPESSAASSSEDKDDEGTYEGHTLDLPMIVRELMLLELEPYPRCEDETACDTRTDALLAAHHEDEPAEEAAIDPRWAALKKIELKSS